MLVSPTGTYIINHADIILSFNDINPLRIRMSGTFKKIGKIQVSSLFFVYLLRYLYAKL